MIQKANFLEKAAKIKLLILDVDGVLTDGRLYFSPAGEELKVFHVQDGLGIKLLQQNGVKVAVITSRQSSIVEQRLRSLGVEHIYQGQEDKRIAFADLIEKLNLKHDEIAYLGDDLPDLALIRVVGLGMAPANAASFIKQHAVWCTEHSGGKGAVREVCELIMEAKGVLNSTLENYL